MSKSKSDKPDKIPSDQSVRNFITGKTKAGLHLNLFVRAGAGAGKTSCLQDRVLNFLLISDIKPEKLAVITYTTKAAAEIKDRIRLSLEKIASTGKLDEKDDEDFKLRSKAINLLGELNKAKMGTVHSFCFDLLREYPVEFNVDPSCDIADDRATANLRSEVRRKFYETIALRDKAFKKDIELIREAEGEFPGLFDAEEVFVLFNYLYENRELKPAVLDELSQADKEKLRSSALELLKDSAQFLSKDILNAIKPGKEDDKLFAQREEILAELSSFGYTGEESTLSILLEGFIEKGESTFPSAGLQSNYKKAETLKDYKDKVKELNALLKQLSQVMIIRCYNLLVKVFPFYLKIYDFHKRERALLDFADCLLLLRNGLSTNVFLRGALQNRFEKIIVDEFQDSDPLQSEIMFHLSANDEQLQNWEKQELEPGKITFMGDPKQSIYGFARADITIYLKVMKLLLKQQKKSEQILSTNFRSSPEIVNFVNQYFSKIIVPHLNYEEASPIYEDMVAYKEDSEFTKPKNIGVQIFELSFSHGKDVAGANGIGDNRLPGIPEMRNREAWIMAKFVAEMIKDKHAKAGDFMILFRKSTGMESYEEAFNKFEIPVVNTKTKSFLKSPSVMSLVALAGVLVRPNDLNYLYSCLKGPFFNLSDLEILEHFQECAYEEVDGKRKKVFNVLERLAKRDSRVVPIFKLIRSSESLPERFELLCKQLSLYATAGVVQDQDLLSSVVKLKEIIKSELALNDFNEKDTMDNIVGGVLKSDNNNQNDGDEMGEEKLVLDTFKPSKVRLMTVHSAKGLESRFVILANPASDLMKKVDVITDRTKNSILPAKAKVLGKSLKDLTELKPAVTRDEVFKIEEEKRVLYVAITRAIEGLILPLYKEGKTGSFADPLYSILDKKTPKTDLSIGDDYFDRHKPSKSKLKTSEDALSEVDYIEKQTDIVNKFNERAAASQAVTTKLKAEAESLFKNNPDGRERGKDFGTLVHSLMEWVSTSASQKMDISSESAYKKLEQLNALLEEPFGSQEINEIKVAIDKILSSELYKKIVAAKNILPEVNFQISGVVHGIMDLVFIDNEGLHIIDWKTDKFSTPEREKLVKAYYKKQIDAYAEALEKHLGQKVASKQCVYLME